MGSAPHEHARVYFEAVKERYREYQEAAQGNQMAVIRYYTPAGHEVRVAHITLDDRYGTLLIKGDDGQGNPCDVITSPQSAQVVIRLLTYPQAETPPESERKPIGFTAVLPPED